MISLSLFRLVWPCVACQAHRLVRTKPLLENPERVKRWRSRWPNNILHKHYCTTRTVTHTKYSQRSYIRTLLNHTPLFTTWCRRVGSAEIAPSRSNYCSACCDVVATISSSAVSSSNSAIRVLIIRHAIDPGVCRHETVLVLSRKQHLVAMRKKRRNGYGKQTEEAPPLSHSSNIFTIITTI